jgi:soluble lytic murein transglycosylase-like protein
MLRTFICCSVVATFGLATLPRPASASWLTNAAYPQKTVGHARARISRQVVVSRPPEQASAYEGLVAQYASANGIPSSLVQRVIMRESRYNPRAVSGGNYGLMQIRLGTARAMGYSGSAAGLLDAETNMTYAIKYLAGAYRAAGGNEARAVALYARGY